MHPFLKESSLFELNPLLSLLNKLLDTNFMFTLQNDGVITLEVYKGEYKR